MPKRVSTPDTPAATLTPGARQQIAVARAEFRHGQLREVLAQTPAAICVTRGPDHIVDTINERYRELIGDAEVIGRKMREASASPDERTIELMDLAYQTAEPQKVRELPIAVQTPGGPQVRFFDYVYQPLLDESRAIYGLMAHGVDVTEQVQVRRALEARTLELEQVAARLRLAVEAGRLGTWEWELPGRRVIWSPEIERIHGLELGTFGGTFAAFQEDIHPDDRDCVLAQIEDTLANRSPYLLEYRIIRPDGELRWIEARGQMFLNSAGEPERVVGVCMDITERKQAEATLHSAAEALERSNRELDAFAYAASHDLRAPLRGIANLAGWIEEDLTSAGELRAETHEMLDLMRSRMHRMEALIEGILQYSRAGRTPQRVEGVDTRRLVGDVVDLLAPGDGVTINIGDLPTLQSAVLPLQQIFMNLIGNALKHSDRRDAVIDIDAADRGRFYQFSVRDNGVGIPREYHQRIWGIFQTLEPRDKVEGTGIGLSLVKKLVESQHGQVWLESSAGQGATFFFLWPRNP